MRDATLPKGIDVKAEFLWFDDCPNHSAARQLLRDVLNDAGLAVAIEDINLTDPELAAAWRFPGSPTIRIDGVDVEPNFEDPGEYTPRCRLYATSDGLRGIPERSWIVDAITASR